MPDLADLPPDLFCVGIGIAVAGCLLGIEGVAGLEIAAADRALHPVGGHLLGLLRRQRGADGLFQGHRFDGYQAAQGFRVGGYVVAQPVDEGAGNVDRYRGHQSQPVGG